MSSELLGTFHRLVWCSHRRRIKTEKKAKVVAAVWGTELIKSIAALAILLQDIAYRPGAIYPILQFSRCKIAIAWQRKNRFRPQTVATTFAFIFLSFFYGTDKRLLVVGWCYQIGISLNQRN